LNSPSASNHRFDPGDGTHVTGELRDHVVEVSTQEQLVEQRSFFDFEVVARQNVWHKSTLRESGLSLQRRCSAAFVNPAIVRSISKHPCVPPPSANRMPR
jgi:hypothetical protein